MLDDAGSGGRVTDQDIDLFWTTRADDALFETFYEGYDAAFSDGPEKEDRDGFRTCLELNDGPEHARLAAQHGPFVEAVAVAARPGSDEAVGGANFFLARAVEDQRPTCNLNYIFTTPPWRGRGQFRPLVKAIRHLIESLGSAEGTAPLIFLEVSDPFRMAAEGADPDKARRALATAVIWARAGARLLALPYVQPALSTDVAPSTTLAYAVLGAPSDGVDAKTLKHHLERFFAISVAKGEPLDARAHAYLAGLPEGPDAIALIDPHPLCVDSDRTMDLLETGPDRPASLGVAVRALTAGDQG